MNGTTGHTCQVSGVYKCATHPTNTIPLAKGNTFPPCSRDGGHSTTWIFMYPA